MVLDINQFKTRIGDNLPTSFYEVTMAPPVGGGDLINLRTESITAPGVAFFAVDNYSPHGNGLTYSIPYRYNPQEITMVHTIDEDGDIYDLFRQWAKEIVDLDGTAQYSAKYFDNYTCDAQIEIYNRQRQKTNTINLIDMYPTVIEPVQLGWGQFDEIAKLSVTYRFLRYTTT